MKKATPLKNKYQVVDIYPLSGVFFSDQPNKPSAGESPVTRIRLIKVGIKTTNLG